MPSLEVRCTRLTCGKSYLLKEGHSVAGKTCPACGDALETLPTAGDVGATIAPETGGAGPDANPAAGTPAPKRLGRFEIRGRLGAGAFGLVYRAFDPLLARDVAIKVPRAAMLEKPAAVARFLREPKAAAQLRHPHIVPIFDAGVESGTYYIASAFIEGTTLEAAVARQPLDFRRAADTIRELAEALDYAHRLGVVHRDIKPANIMLDARGDALLMDFGLARLDASDEITQDGTLLGTPAYMAPEQAARNQEAVGPHSDQYSLGVVLYELLCGKRPFSGLPAVVIYNAIHEPPPAPRAIRPDIPVELETIVLKTLAKQPSERYANCQELAADLRRWLDDQPIRARKAPAWEKVKRWTKRNPVLAVLCGAIAVLAVASTSAAVELLFSRGKLEESLANAKTLTAAAEEQTKIARTQTALALEQEALAREEEKKALELEQSSFANKQRADDHESAARATLKDLEGKKSERAKIDKRTAELAAEFNDKTKLLDATEKATLVAEAALVTTERERLAAEAAAQWLEYGELLTQAEFAISGEDFPLATKRLGECAKELRGWEWTVLSRLAANMKVSQSTSQDRTESRGDSGHATMYAARHDGSWMFFASGAKQPTVMLQHMSEKWSPIPFGRDDPAALQRIAFSRFNNQAVRGAKLFNLPAGKERTVRFRALGIDEPTNIYGFTEDGRLLLTEADKPRSITALAAREGLKLGPEAVFPGIQMMSAVLDHDGKTLLALGLDPMSAPGIFYGPYNATPEFFPWSESGAEICVARAGLAAIRLRDGSLIGFDYRAGRLTEKYSVPGRPLGISPDGRRLLVAAPPTGEAARIARQPRFPLSAAVSGGLLQNTGCQLVETTGGRAVPKLGILPWVAFAKPDATRIPRYGEKSLFFLDDWTEFYQFENDRGSYQWQRWNLATR